MKQLTITLLIVILQTTVVLGQHREIDSLYKILKKEHSDTARAIILYNLSYAYQTYKPDSALFLAQEAYDIALRENFLKGQSWASDAMAGAYLRMGNNTKALEYSLKRLKIEELRNLPNNIAIINMNLANVYNRDNDTTKAIFYILKSDSIIEINNYEELKLYTWLNTGNIFERANRLPDALYYTYKCYNLAVEKNDSIMIGSALNNLGNIFLKMNDSRKAIKNYLNSQAFLLSKNDNQSLSEGLLGMAKAYRNLNRQDSALLSAKKAYEISYSNGILKNALEASVFITKSYSQLNALDSAFRYQSIMISLKDSLQGIEKIKQLESLSIGEQLRQQQMALQRKQEAEETRQRLQLLAIGIIIPLFFFLSIYISRKRVHKSIIEFSGIISLLLLFEYITLLLHPVVVELTHHTPILEILIFVGIAALMVPAHHRIQKWFTKHLARIHDKHAHRPETPIE